jgi:hypothetical protein
MSIFPPSKKSLIISVIILILVGSLGGSGYYFYSQYKKSQAELELISNNPQEADRLKVQKVIDKISHLIVVPANELPSLVTVKDKTLLTNQPFFANAENGDELLYYAAAKKAILYRPSLDKLVEVFPNVTLTSNTNPTGTPAPSPVEPQPTPSQP